jgi:hypothetical protein
VHGGAAGKTHWYCSSIQWGIPRRAIAGYPRTPRTARSDTLKDYRRGSLATEQQSIPMTVQAMKAGAMEFLTKPFRYQDLLDAVNGGLGRDRAWRENKEALSALGARFCRRVSDPRPPRRP